MSIHEFEPRAFAIRKNREHSIDDSAYVFVDRSGEVIRGVSEEEQAILIPDTERTLA